MKKIPIICIVCVLLLIFGCSIPLNEQALLNAEIDVVEIKPESTPEPEEEEPLPLQETDSEAAVTFSVRPEYYPNHEDRSAAVAEAQENGIDALLMEDGSITYTMTQTQYEQYCSFARTIYEMDLNAVLPAQNDAIVRIETNASLSEFRFYVDAAQWESSGASLKDFNLPYIYANAYSMYIGKEFEFCDYILLDNATETEITRVRLTV